MQRKASKHYSTNRRNRMAGGLGMAERQLKVVLIVIITVGLANKTVGMAHRYAHNFFGQQQTQRGTRSFNVFYPFIWTLLIYIIIYDLQTVI